jgi:hypothetical protein
MLRDTHLITPTQEPALFLFCAAEIYITAELLDVQFLAVHMKSMN